MCRASVCRAGEEEKCRRSRRAGAACRASRLDDQVSNGGPSEPGSKTHHISHDPQVQTHLGGQKVKPDRAPSEPVEPDERPTYRFLTSRPEVDCPSLALGGEDYETADELCFGRNSVSLRPVANSLREAEMVPMLARARRG